MRYRALRGCLIAIAFLSASHAIPKQNTPRQSSQKTEIPERKNSDSAPDNQSREPFPPWIPAQLAPQIIQIITQEKPKESANCGKGDNLRGILACSWVAFWGYITPEQMTAIFTALLALFTICLWKSTNRLAEDAKESIVLAQRPRLRVRNVVVNGYGVAMYQPGDSVEGQFYVSNVGGTIATITESHCMIYWSKIGLPMRRPYEGEVPNNPVSKGTQIPPGASRPVLFSWIGDHESDIGSKHIAYIMGWIEYIDGIKIKRRTAFCRIFKEDRPRFIYGRFHAVNDPDYEHEE
jgi:hypothetical protein